MAVTFLATIAMLQSAIQIAGDGGARVKLDIDDTGIDAVVALMAMRGELLSVTVDVVHNKTDHHGETPMAEGRKRKSERRAAESAPADARP